MYLDSKVGYVFAMVVVFILPHAEFWRKHHREDAPHFRPLRLKLHKSKPLQCIVVLSKMNSSITKLINILLSIQIVRHGILFGIWILQTCYHLPSFWILEIDRVVNRLNLWVIADEFWKSKVGCVFPMVILSEFQQLRDGDHPKDAPTLKFRSETIEGRTDR